tara:strand:+ start:486 stop:1070 length:585 start_codon:yes stop_codon:yes gene_type:complete
MASQIKVNEIIKQSGSSISIGESGDTINVSGSALTQGITNAEQWWLTSTQAIGSADTDTLITPFARYSLNGATQIGSIVSSDAGTFSFSQTGKYLISFFGYYKRTNHLVQYAGNKIKMTTNNSTYNDMVQQFTNLQDSASTHGGTVTQGIFDISDTSNCKIRFYAQVSDASGIELQGNTGKGVNYANFLRIGDT